MEDGIRIGGGFRFRTQKKKIGKSSGVSLL
jgi:hypothetical protein